MTAIKKEENWFDNRSKYYLFKYLTIFIAVISSMVFLSKVYGIENNAFLMEFYGSENNATIYITVLFSLLAISFIITFNYWAKLKLINIAKNSDNIKHLNIASNIRFNKKFNNYIDFLLIDNDWVIDNYKVFTRVLERNLKVNSLDLLKSVSRLEYPEYLEILINSLNKINDEIVKIDQKHLKRDRKSQQILQPIHSDFMDLCLNIIGNIATINFVKEDVLETFFNFCKDLNLNIPKDRESPNYERIAKNGRVYFWFEINKIKLLFLNISEIDRIKNKTLYGLLIIDTEREAVNISIKENVYNNPNFKMEEYMEEYLNDFVNS